MSLLDSLPLNTPPASTQIKSELFLVTSKAPCDPGYCDLFCLTSCRSGPSSFCSRHTGFLVSQVQGPQGPLHVLFPLPGMIFPRCSYGFLSFHTGLCPGVSVSKYHLPSFCPLSRFTFFQSTDPHPGLYYSLCTRIMCLPVQSRGCVSCSLSVPRARLVHGTC